MTKHSTINLLIIIAVIAAIVFFGFNFLKMNTSFQEELDFSSGGASRWPS